MEEWEGKK